MTGLAANLGVETEECADCGADLGEWESCLENVSGDLAVVCRDCCSHDSH
jgi:hypothetical protein